MVKDAILTLRLDAAEKQRIAVAARRAGKNSTTFVLEAAMQRVEAVERAPVARRPARKSGARPTFFVALCTTAKAGGQAGYASAGYELARHVHSLAPYDVEDDEWQARVDALERLVEGEDVSEISEWFDENLPRCMALVPSRRREKFVEGVIAFVEDQGALS